MNPIRDLALALAVLLSTAVFASGAETLDSIVARVDQGVVTWSQVIQELELRAWAGDSAGQADPRSVAEALARRRLLVSEAQKMRIEVRPEEVVAEIEALARAGGDPAVFWGRMKALGVSEAELRRRGHDVLMMRRYLAVRQEMTYVPEADVRAFYNGQVEVFGERPLSRVREEVRSLLSQKKYQQELDQWFLRQVAEGRVRFLEIPRSVAGKGRE